MEFLSTISTSDITEAGAVREYRSISGGNSFDGSANGAAAFLPAPVLSGVAVTPESAMTFAAYFACVNVLSTDLASLDMSVRKRLRRGGRVTLHRDIRHDLVYCCPNKNTTPMGFYGSLYSHRFNWGNGYSEIIRRGGMPVELHLHSPRPLDTWPEKSKTGSLWYQVDGGKRQVRAEDMIHLAGLGFNGLTGFSVCALARQAIGYGLAAEQFGAAFYGNASTPRGALKVPKNLTPEMIRNMRESYASVHAGTENAHRLLILEEGVEFQPMAISPEDAQYLATRQFQVIEMCRLFRVPPHKIMDYSQAGSAYRALEESNLDYVLTTLGPESKRMRQETDRKFFTRQERLAGLHTANDFSEYLAGSKATRMAYYAARLAAGSITPDMIAEVEGDEPVDSPGGKRYYLSNGLHPLDDVPEATPEEPAAAAPDTPEVLEGNAA